MLYSAVYLVASSQDSSLASQTKTDGTHNARLASSIGSDNHVQIGSRIHLSVVIGPARGKSNFRYLKFYDWVP